MPCCGELKAWSNAQPTNVDSNQYIIEWALKIGIGPRVHVMKRETETCHVAVGGWRASLSPNWVRRYGVRLLLCHNNESCQRRGLHMSV